MRFVYLLIFIVLYFMRLDSTYFPLGWSWLDGPHASFKAVALIDHIFNNPINVTFCDIIRKELEWIQMDKINQRERRLQLQNESNEDNTIMLNENNRREVLKKLRVKFLRLNLLLSNFELREMTQEKATIKKEQNQKIWNENELIDLST